MYSHDALGCRSPGFLLSSLTLGRFLAFDGREGEAAPVDTHIGVGSGFLLVPLHDGVLGDRATSLRGVNGHDVELKGFSAPTGTFNLEEPSCARRFCR